MVVQLGREQPLAHRHVAGMPGLNKPPPTLAEKQDCCSHLVRPKLTLVPSLAHCSADDTRGAATTQEENIGARSDFTDWRQCITSAGRSVYSVRTHWSRCTGPERGIYAVMSSLSFVE